MNNEHIYEKKCTIYNTLFNESSTIEIVNVAEITLDNPIFILDTSYHLLTRSNLAKEENSSLEMHNGEYYLILDTIKLMKENKCIDNIYNYDKSFFHYDNQNLIFCPIKTNNITTFFICVLETNRKFSNEDLELTDTLSKVLSLHFEKENKFISNSGSDEEYYLMELLMNKADNIKHIAQRLNHINFRIHKNLIVISIPFKQHFKDYRHNFGLKEVIKNIKKILGNCIFTYYKEKIVFLISSNNEEIIHQSNYETLLEFLRLNSLCCGVSMTFNNILTINEFFHQSIYALDISKTLDDNLNIAFFENYIEHYLFKICSDNEGYLYKLDLLTLVHPAIKKLQDFDKNNKTELLKTLKEYLINNRNSNATANKLNIHRSTFFYRFRKIENILCISLGDNNNLFKLELSFKILDYINIK